MCCSGIQCILHSYGINYDLQFFDLAISFQEESIPQPVFDTPDYSVLQFNCSFEMESSDCCSQPLHLFLAYFRGCLVSYMLQKETCNISIVCSRELYSFSIFVFQLQLFCMIVRVSYVFLHICISTTNLVNVSEADSPILMTPVLPSSAGSLGLAKL